MSFLQMKTLKKLTVVYILGITLFSVVMYISDIAFMKSELPEEKRLFHTNEKSKQNVVFLKTHKTGGTTLQNILMRYGEINNLMFVFFKSRDGLMPNRHFPADMVPKLVSGKEYNIICRHARFDKAAMQSVMPKDTIYITMIRDPIMHFKSIFWYYNWPLTLGISNKTNPLVYYIDNMDAPMFEDKGYFPFGLLLFELGMEPVDLINESKVNETIQQLGRDFHLVMLTEYFDESLVLLRRILNWKLSDMVYIKMRVRDRETETLTEEQEAKVRSKNRMQSLLYDYFNQTLWKKINEHGGSSFWEEVHELRRLRSLATTNCLGSNLQESNTFGDGGQFYKIREDASNKPLCNRLVVSPIPYTVYLIKKQLPLLLDKTIAMFYRFVPRGFWKYSSWDPIHGLKKIEDIYERVCHDSGNNIEDCKEKVKPLHVD